MSTTNQIGRLIESLSKGSDAGSFNIFPLQDGSQVVSAPGYNKVPFDRSVENVRGDNSRPTSSLRSDLSVDAQLEHMIGKLNSLSRSASQREP